MEITTPNERLYAKCFPSLLLGQKHFSEQFNCGILIDRFVID